MDGLDISPAGLLAVALLIVDVAVILRLATSHAVVSVKLLWIALVLVLPFLGALLWLFLGPRQPERDEA